MNNEFDSITLEQLTAVTGGKRPKPPRRKHRYDGPDIDWSNIPFGGGGGHSYDFGPAIDRIAQATNQAAFNAARRR